MDEPGRKLWTGPCAGGPLGAPGSTEQGVSRYPNGFVYVDMPNQLTWIYDWSEQSQKFFARSETPMPLDRAKLRALRDRYDWDVLTASEEVSNVNHGTTRTGQDS